jgi:hypothetical protein
MLLLESQEDKSFEQWFRDNTDIPEGIEPFTLLDDGTYFWKETRDQLARWLDIKSTLAKIEDGMSRRLGSFGRFWVLGEDNRTLEQTNDIMAWGLCREDEKRSRVGWDLDKPNRILVSTVFLGVCHGMVDDKPILFETMILTATSSRIHDRYCTWDEAEAGHKAACAVVGLTPQLPSHIEGEVVSDTPALPAPDNVD